MIRRVLAIFLMIPLFAFVAPQEVLGQAEMTQDTSPVKRKLPKQGTFTLDLGIHWEGKG